MASSVTFRLADEDRVALQAAAEAAGSGISAYMRGLAETEVRRLRAERIRAESLRVAAAIGASDDAQAEAELLTGDGEGWPEWTGPLPG